VVRKDRRMRCKEKRIKNIPAGIIILISMMIIYNDQVKDDQIVITLSDIKSHRYLTSDELNQLSRNIKFNQKRNGKVTYSHPDKFAEYHKAIRTRANQISSDYVAGYRIKELKKAQTNNTYPRAKTQQLEWMEHGPANVPGRTRAILVLPEDREKNTWLAGAVGGGIWKTTNAGESWTYQSEGFPNLSVSSLAYAESNPSIIYAGTGESFGAGGVIEVSGQGMFKSIDGGISWEHLSSTIDLFKFMAVNEILVDPDDPDILLISANQNIGRGLSFSSGIFKSIDGGLSWYQVYEPNGWIQQIIHEPGNFNIQYASVFGNGVAKSENAGETWRVISNGLFPNGRLEIAISNNNTNLMYASVEGELSGVESDLYISEDGGQNWQLIIEENDITNRNFFAATPNSPAQGGWNNTIAVHPYNDQIVYVGGVDLWKMEILAGEVIGERSFKGVVEEGTHDFMDFVNFASGTLWGSRLAVGDIPEEAFVSVELRFGPGMSQKAHRFETPFDGGTDGDGGAGIPDEEYEFMNYVEIPFEVWDIENDKQLMVSFRDQAKDGTWNLISERTDGPFETQSREYFFIHDIDYDPDGPDTQIAANGGHTFQQMYFMWPYLSEDAIFNPEDLPESSLTILWGTLIKRIRRTTRMTSWIGEGSEQEKGRFLPYVHADQHTIIPVIVNNSNQLFKLLVTNDGGVFHSLPDTDPGLVLSSWISAGQGYNTSQFYGIDKKPGKERYVGGLQDNGTYLSSVREDANRETDYLEVGGGDGMETVWNYRNEREILISNQNNSFSKTFDEGNTWFQATNGLADVNDNAPFITKVGNSKSQPDVVYTVGASGVWKSSDFADSWNLTPINEFWPLSTSMDVEVSLSDYSVVWAGSGMSDNARIYVSSDAGSNFYAVNNFNDVELGTITGIATHPFEDSTAYILFSFAGAPKILRTKDLGQEWEDISGFGTSDQSSNGFPDVAVHSLLVLPHDPEIIWAGTEIGIFQSLDNGVSWQILYEFPAVSIWDMKQVDNKIVVGTHGRGIWSVNIPELPEIAVIPRIVSMGINFKKQLLINTELNSAYDSSYVIINDELKKRIGPTVMTDSILVVDYDQEEYVTVSIRAFRRGAIFESNSQSIDLFYPDDPVEKYVNEFGDLGSSEDFIGNGFEISTKTGFDSNDYAIHSEHNYQEDTQYVYLLKKPVIIIEDEAFFQYDDVAIIEPGEPGSQFGDLTFWDFVVVEGSSNGITWKPIKKGYDARLHGSWLSTYNNNQDGNKNLFKPHIINLHTTFNPGDTVFFRFRLFSDEEVTGWGWVIDNLYIQELKPVGLNDNGNAVKQDMNVFPNPFNSVVTIQFYTNNPGTAKVEIIDINGKISDYLTLNFNGAGEHQFSYDARGLSKGLYIFKISNSKKVYQKKLIKY